LSTSHFDVLKFKSFRPDVNQYQRQLKRLKSGRKGTESIEAAVSDASSNLIAGERRSFVIYGEPQSGKTEMMICLTAKLLDDGRQFILHLLNDSVDLLGQNLGRFQASGLAPTAKNYTDILDPAIRIADRQHVVFCKKNPKDLEKLLQKIGKLERIVIIDDEADYASPNAKINKNTRTRINALITALLGESGDYIGVTATPARLDLNNTFENDSSIWVNFPPHKLYTGQDIFFPIDHEQRNSREYQLTLLPATYDGPKFAREAFFSFLANVAYLNRKVNSAEQNYSMLIHTSGKKIDHKADWYVFDKIIAALIDKSGADFESYVRQIWNIARKRFVDSDPDELTSYVVDNISRYAILILNSDRDFVQNGASATNPSALFTIIIGGNIVSRGVTFENLLSMFFTRDSKHKIQQDTYIQRARMFGSRLDYLRHFELTIPEPLYVDWHRCFVFHKLALSAIRTGLGSPVWLADSRIAPVANASIDRTNVSLDRGEMTFSLFDYDPHIWKELDQLDNPINKLQKMQDLIGEKALPDYLLSYVKQTTRGRSELVGVHPATSIANYRDADQNRIERRKGFFGKSQRERFSTAAHHFAIFHNDSGKARLIYKFVGSISFIKNLKHV
jgi:hypothetical protein